VSRLHLLALYGLVAAAVAICLWRRANRAELRAATILFVLGVGPLILPLVLASGTFFHRNLIVVLPPLLLLAGLACGLRNEGRTALAVGCVAAAALLIPSALIADRRSLQREDWRDTAALVGGRDTSRAILTYPRFEYIALLHYRPQFRVVDSGTLRVRELLVVGRPRLDTLRLPSELRPVEDKRLGTLRILKLRAATPRKLDVEALDLRPVLRLLHQTRYMQKAPGQDATLLVDR
jgi:hypothetical protein